MSSKRLTSRVVAAIAPVKQSITVYDRDFPAFFVRVYPNGLRRFGVRFQHQGVRRSYVIGDAAVMPLTEAKALAKAKIHAARHSLSANNNDGASASDDKPVEPVVVPTLSEYAKVFFRDYARHWKPNTLRHSESGYRLHIEPVLGHLRVDAIDHPQVVRWFAGMAEQTGMANRLLPVLSVMLQQAALAGFRSESCHPCRGIRRYPAKKQARYLTVAELQRLWSALDDDFACIRLASSTDSADAQVADSQHAAEPRPQTTAASARMIIRLLLLTGCRCGEVRTLQWSYYRCGHWYLPDSKTGAKTVWLSSPVRALLAVWPRYGKYLFPARRSDQPLGKGQLYTVWSAVREQAQLEQIRLHDLRHTYASLAIQQRVPLRTVGQLLGHALSETTLHYVQLADETVQQAADHIAGLLAEVAR